MEKGTALKPCNYKGHEARSTELADRLSGLPHDVLLLILSSFTAKEVARTRLVSNRWKTWLLRYFPKLNFENPMVMEKLWERGTVKMEFLSKERSAFVRRVDLALREYLDASIDELRIKFDLDKSYQSDIDKWLDYAFAKRVKRLELDFDLGGSYRLDSELNQYSLGLKCYELGVNQSLASLCLKYVDINSEVVERLLHWCPFLEKLCIEGSDDLTDIRSSCPSLRLKHLDVSYCPWLVTIDISVPKMVFFRYYGVAVELKIQNASSLSAISIGSDADVEVLQAFEPLSPYFLQLEVLSLHIISNYKDGERISSHMRNGSPLKYLKTLEVFGYRGYRADFELASFVLQNAYMLQEVIVDVGLPYYSEKIVDPDECVKELREKIPQGVKFVLMNSNA